MEHTPADSDKTLPFANADRTHTHIQESDVPPKNDSTMSLPLLPREPRSLGEGDMEMVDRLKQWEVQFIRSAERALRTMHGYESATVTDYRCLATEPGYDEDDYELTVQIGAGQNSDEIGHEGVSTIKRVVRRVSADALRS